MQEMSNYPHYVSEPQDISKYLREALPSLVHHDEKSTLLILTLLAILENTSKNPLNVSDIEEDKLPMELKNLSAYLSYILPEVTLMNKLAGQLLRLAIQQLNEWRLEVDDNLFAYPEYI
jgi:hypothetical protein